MAASDTDEGVVNSAMTASRMMMHADRRNDDGDFAGLTSGSGGDKHIDKGEGIKVEV
jgi:hypothetical protein